MWAKMRSWWRSLRDRKGFESDLSAEFEHHLESRKRHLMQSGLSQGEARRRARREFGDAEALKRDCRQARGLYWSDELARHAGFALRLLRRHPTFAVSVLLTLGLTIGANTAIYSIVDGLLIQPLPYRQPERLYVLTSDIESPRGSARRWSHSGAEWEVVRDRAQGLETACFSGWPQGSNLVVGEWARHVSQGRVGAGYFQVLGVELPAGREFSSAEDSPLGGAVAILGHDLAESLFAGPQQALGQDISLAGQPHQVIGVLPSNFRSPYGEEVWTPLRPSTQGEGEGANYGILIRPGEGLSSDQAQAQISLLSGTLAEAARLPDDFSVRYRLAPLQSDLVREVKRPLVIIWVAVGLTLLIGCVNIAGLLLARQARRRRELAVRYGLGGGRGAVIRQMLTESLVMAALGALLGTGLGYLGKEGLELLAQDAFGLWQPVAFNLRVLLVTSLSALLASLLFGLAPAWQAARLDVRQSLSQGSGRSSQDASSRRFSHLLVVAQVALGVVLLVAAGLLLRTLLHLRALDPGIDPSGVVTGKLSLTDARYRDPQSVQRLFVQSLQQIRASAGVEEAAVALTLPYERAVNLGFRLQQDGEQGPGQVTDAVYVTPGFFQALRVPLLQGRLLEPRDDQQHSPVAVVNRAFVERYLDGGPALGRRLAAVGEMREIVGVVGDVQHRPVWGGQRGPLGNVPTLYVAAQQSSGLFRFAHRFFSPSWVVRSRLSEAEAAEVIRSAVHSLDPLLPFSRFQSMDSVMAESWSHQRLQAFLMLALAALALLLSTVGLYGVVAQAALRRRRETGIRMALGCGRWRAVLRVALPGMVLTLVGAGLGTLGAWSGMRLLDHLLTGVTAHDPLTFLSVLGLVVGAALAASLLPPLRVTRATPSQILRRD
ncbi:MAG TPA: ADOP family duplicated permease [Acidobacteriota bacterium]|nr:ADOP family duplicated permease [Acidobacteriota bacterium]